MLMKKNKCVNPVFFLGVLRSPITGWQFTRKRAKQEIRLFYSVKPREVEEWDKACAKNNP